MQHFMQGGMMELFLFWFIFAVVIGVAASSRGRSGLGWWLLAMIISPVLALVLLVLLPSLRAEAVATGHSIPTPDTHVKCPDCAELVLREARVCKHCGCKLVPQPVLP
jgi:hypothetical protein